MPGCNLEREVLGGIALYRISGRFEGACAWELSARLEREPLHHVVVDFAQVGEFVDYGIAVMANALNTLDKQVRLRGLGQPQERPSATSASRLRRRQGRRTISPF